MRAAFGRMSVIVIADLFQIHQRTGVQACPESVVGKQEPPIRSLVGPHPVLRELHSNATIEVGIIHQIASPLFGIGKQKLRLGFTRTRRISIQLVEIVAPCESQQDGEQY